MVYCGCVVILIRCRGRERRLDVQLKDSLVNSPGEVH